jgi:hypothetical protein
VNRIITGEATGNRMTVGELRAFLDSLEGVPDDTPVKAKTTRGSHLRSVTIEERVQGTAPAEEIMFGRSVSE